LLEQADVLDGDDSLIGEGLEQIDVAVGKGTRFGSLDDDRANGRAVAQHRHCEDASPVASARNLPPIRWISENVFDLHAGPREDRPTRGLVGLWGPRVDLAKSLELLWPIIVIGAQMHELAVELLHAPHLRATEAHRAGRDGVEHGLDVRR